MYEQWSCDGTTAFGVTNYFFVFMCSKHDRAYRRWMPHINLLYPFIIDNPTGKSFSMAADKLTPVLAIVPSFQIRFDAESFRFFRHGKNCTLWLKPQANTSCVLGEISYLLYSFQSIQNFEICCQGNICMSHWGWTLLSDRVKKQPLLFLSKVPAVTPTPEVMATPVDFPPNTLSVLIWATWTHDQIIHSLHSFYLIQAAWPIEHTRN